jgi:hypothetical protein
MIHLIPLNRRPNDNRMSRNSIPNLGKKRTIKDKQIIIKPNIISLFSM